MNSGNGSKYKQVQGLMKGMNLLYALNRLNGGARIADLATLTGMHRTTVRRLLETLIHEGYVRCSESDDSYWLERKVRDLSEGYRDEEWVSALAAPLLSELLHEVNWPTDLTTLDGDCMVIRETTHRYSRLSFHRSMVSRRLPLLFTASGRAYLAYCPDSERKELLAMLAVRGGGEGKLARDNAYINKLISETRGKGYGANYKEWTNESRFAAIALPITHRQRVYGCLGLVYMAKAMSTEVAAERYLGALEKVIAKIAEGIDKVELF